MNSLFRRCVVRIAAATSLLALAVVAQGPIRALQAQAPGATSDAALLARVAALEAKVAYLEDRQQIHDTYLRFMWEFDRRDAEMLKSAFWPDAEINYGTVSHHRSSLSLVISRLMRADS